MVASHGKLGMLFLDDEVVQVLRQGELIAETEAIVVETEADLHIALLSLLMQRYQQLIVMVADVAGLPPYGLPRLIEGTRLLTSERKTALEVGLAGAGCACSPLSGIFLIGVSLQFQTKF